MISRHTRLSVNVAYQDSKKGFQLTNWKEWQASKGLSEDANNGIQTGK